MDIAIISDFHGHWFELELPPADILIIAGDILDFYAADQKINARDQLFEIEQLNLFLEPYTKIYKKILVVAGNHDFAFQYFPKEARKKLSNAIYLEDSSFTFEGLKFYGSPWQPWFGGWAFNFIDHNANFEKSMHQRIAVWDKIPEDTDILITHTPPFGILDKNFRGKNCGCEFLAQRLDRLKSLILHTFGHIHYSRGTLQKDGALFVNACNGYTHNSVDQPATVISIDENLQTHVKSS